MFKKMADTGVALVYTGSQAEYRVMQTQKTRAFPGISDAEGMTKYYEDHPGSRKAFKRLLEDAQKGDHVVIVSVFALADAGDEKTMMARLRKLNHRGLHIHVALENDFSFADYDEMYKVQSRLQEQRAIFEELCVDIDGRYRMWDSAED